MEQKKQSERERQTMNIKELRLKTGMTQKVFAEYFEVELDTLQNWEQGRRRCPAPLLKLMEYKLKKEKLI